jgi:hypothetical protein
MPIAPEVYGHALIARGWMEPEQITRPPMRWNYTSDCAGNRARNLFARIRNVAIKVWDARGIDLLGQIIQFIEDARSARRVEGIFNARRCLSVLAQGKYPHFQSLVDEIDEVIDEMARLLRGEIIARLLTGAIAGDEAVEAIAALQDDPAAVARLLSGIEDLEAIADEEVRGFGT